MADVVLLDHSKFFKDIPLSSLTDVPASNVKWKQNNYGCGILLRDGRHTRYGFPNSIILAKNLIENQKFGQTDVSNRIEFELPRSNGTVVKEGIEYFNRHEVMALTSGKVKIVLDLYQKHLDSGGYYTRKYALIILGKTGELLYIDAKEYLASRWFMVFGSIGKFKVKKQILCGSEE